MSNDHIKVATLLIEEGYVDEAIQVLKHKDAAIAKESGRGMGRGTGRGRGRGRGRQRPSLKDVGWSEKTKSNRHPERNEIVLHVSEFNNQAIIFDANTTVYRITTEHNSVTDEFDPFIQHIKAKNIKYTDESVFLTPKAAWKDYEQWVSEGERNKDSHSFGF